MIRTSLFAAGVALCALAAGPAAPPTSQPSTQPAAIAAPAADVAVGDAYTLAKGAYRLGDYRRAAELAESATREMQKNRVPLTDSAMVDAIHLQGVSLLRAGQAKRASDTFSRVYSAMAGDRTLTFNAALCDLLEKSTIVRAAKTLGAYGASHPEDEQVLNLWGCVIDTIGQEGKNPAKLKEFWAAFNRANAQLEATRPGMRRWGTQWMTAAEYKVIEDKRAFQQEVVDQAVRERDKCVARLKRAQAAYNQAQMPIGGSGIHANCRYSGDGCRTCLERERRWKMESAQRDIDHWTPLAQEANTRCEQAVAKLPKPTWAVSMEPLDPIE
jgi:hypothetical protein